MASAARNGSNLLTSTLQSEAPSWGTEDVLKYSLGRLSHSGTSLEQRWKGEQQGKPDDTCREPCCSWRWTESIEREFWCLLLTSLYLSRKTEPLTLRYVCLFSLQTLSGAVTVQQFAPNMSTYTSTCLYLNVKWPPFLSDPNFNGKAGIKFCCTGKDRTSSVVVCKLHWPYLRIVSWNKVLLHR